MPETITIGHLLALAALFAAIAAVWHGLSWLRHRGAGRGTPQYARARHGRRYAVWSLAIAALLLAAACLTPLRDMGIG